MVLEKKTTFPCITLARCSVGNTDALGHMYIKKQESRHKMFIVIHMWKCRNVRTTLPIIHLQKYMVKEEANYWAKKAVSFKHLHAKKEKDSANGMMSLYNAIVYRKKIIHLFQGSRVCDHQGHHFFSPAFLWHLNWPGRHSNTSSTAGVDDECFNKRKWQNLHLHSNRQYQGNKTTKIIHL